MIVSRLIVKKVIFFGLMVMSPVVIFTQPIATGQTESTGILQTDQPFHIRHADKLLWERKKDNTIAKLMGKVELYLESDRITINADTVFYYSQKQTYEAIGRVKIVKQEDNTGPLIAHSQKATYHQLENRLYLEGNPKIQQGDNELSGNIMILTLNDTGMTLEGENIRGILYPE